MSRVSDEKTLLFYEGRRSEPVGRCGAVGFCRYCDEKIFWDEAYRSTPDGTVHEECVEDFMDELWDGLTASDKYDLMNGRELL